MEFSNENKRGLPAFGGTTGQGNHETPDKKKLMGF
jgi:hypothetical protein